MYFTFVSVFTDMRQMFKNDFYIFVFGIYIFVIKILVYPDTLLNGTFQDNRQGICVISFDTSTEAHEWLSTDQLVTMRDRWSYGREVNVVLVNLALSRHYPFSLYRKAHMIALLTPSSNSTDFSSVVLPEVTRIYSKYGGTYLANATMSWEHVIGVTWPPNSTDWLFYGPMVDIDSVRKMFTSDDINNITSEFPTLLKSVQFYGIDAFFNTGSKNDSRSGTLLFQCLCVVLHVIYNIRD